MAAEWLVYEQGHGPIDCAGEKVSDFVLNGLLQIAEMVKARPESAKNVYRLPWRVEYVREGTRQPRRGEVQYQILPDGTLGPRVANFDSRD